MSDPRTTGPSATISAVIVSYDEEPHCLRGAVDSLLAQTRAPAEILVLNNGVPGRLAETLHGYPEHVRPIECEANLGYIAINLAPSYATGDYLLVLNPDAEAEADCLEALAAV